MRYVLLPEGDVRGADLHQLPGDTAKYLVPALRRPQSSNLESLFRTDRRSADIFTSDIVVKFQAEFLLKPTVSSAPSTAYTSLSSTFPFILSVHLALERRRILAKRNINARTAYGQDDQDEKVLSDQERGPRVMVLGPANSGKSTMVKGLLNLAVGSGMGWSPGVIGLDPGTVSFCMPLYTTLLRADFLLPSSVVEPLGTRVGLIILAHSSCTDASPFPPTRISADDGSGHDPRLRRPHARLVRR